MQRWKEYCEELCNYVINVDEKVLEELNGRTDRGKEEGHCITESEVRAAICTFNS